MEVKGLLFALLDVEDRPEEYNRWYDLDHFPEHLSKADVVGGRRYVAPPALRGLPESVEGELIGHPPYATAYFLGEGFESEEAAAGWLAKDRTIVKAGRFWRDGRPAFTGRWRLDGVARHPSVLVSDEATPFLPHRGLIVAVGRAASAEQRGDALRWWADVHLPDLFASNAILAALRFMPIDGGQEDMILHLLFCEQDPAGAMTAIAAARPYHRGVGRFPDHRASYEELAFLPYRTIVPFEYDFSPFM
jgi:hypothetical protein